MRTETEKDIKTCGAIIRRYRRLLRDYGVDEGVIPKQLASISLLRRVAVVEDLNIDRLLTMSSPDFGHDVGGILKFADARGKLRNNFWPRCGSMAEARRVAKLVAKYAARHEREEARRVREKNRGKKK